MLLFKKYISLHSLTINLSPHFNYLRLDENRIVFSYSFRSPVVCCRNLELHRIVTISRTYSDMLGNFGSFSHMSPDILVCSSHTLSDNLGNSFHMDFLLLAYAIQRCPYTELPLFRTPPSTILVILLSIIILYPFIKYKVSALFFSELDKALYSLCVSTLIFLHSSLTFSKDCFKFSFVTNFVTF